MSTDVNPKAPLIPSTPLPESTFGENANERLISAVTKWWVKKRPITYTLIQHANNPVVNCTGDSEAEMANALVALRFRGFQDRAKQGSGNAR